MNAVDFDLYLVTDRNQTGGRDLLWVLEQALEGGVKTIQLREKDLSGKDLFYLAERSSHLCETYGAALFINDRVDVALAVDAAGVQLSRSSLPVETARLLLGEKKLIGVSTHSLEQAREAQQVGADFILYGPVYFTPTKAAYGAPQGLPALKAIVDNIALPVYAIGGIKPENIEATRTIGVRGVALISAIVSAENPKEAAVKMLRQLRS
ncbi:MAG TPA: thiamine phosphate synthase [Candidatus Binatia bacterium]|nr:thiamine phosphate synthase [Candidatus Binatia bacterium]